MHDMAWVTEGVNVDVKELLEAVDPSPSPMWVLGFKLVLRLGH